jgi:putative transposase
MKHTPATQLTPEAAAEAEMDFPAGTQLQSAGAYYRVMAGSTAQRLMIQDVHTEDVRICDQTFLRLAVAQRQASVLPADFRVPGVHLQFRTPGAYDEVIQKIPVSLRSEAAVKVMVNKYEWISRLKRHKVTQFQPTEAFAMKLREVEKIHSDKCPYSPHTLYAAWRKLRHADGEVKVLLPRFDRRGGAGQSRLGPRVDAIVQKILTQMEQPSSEKLTASGAYDQVRTAVMAANAARTSAEQLPVPSLPTVSRRFREHFGAYEIAKRNYGKHRADTLFRSAGVRVQAERALDVVMYDDTDSGVFLVDERSGLPWGRCWVTPGIDEFSRSVTGVSMSHEHRSTISATEAVMHSLAPKDKHSRDFELCVSEWYAYGNQGLIVLDNASYNTSYDFQALLIDLGIEYEFAKPHHPTNKTCVEYFHHRMKQEFCRNLPGWAGPKEDREMLDAGIATAVLTRRAFRQSFFRWITDDYSNTAMRSGKSPRQLWDETFRFHKPYLPQRMPSHQLLGTVLTTLRFRDSGGLLRNLLRYQSTQLDVLRKRMGARAEVKVRYRTDDLSFIYVEDCSTGHYLTVPCVEPPQVYEGLTDWQWKLVLKRARALFKGNIGLQQAVQAREKLREETRLLLTSKKMRERKRATQFSPDDTLEAHGAPATDIAVEETVAVSDLEDLVTQLETDCPDASPQMTAVFLSEDER